MKSFMKKFKKLYYTLGAAFTVGILAPGFAHAATYPLPGNNFGKIGKNITDSIANLPGLLTALSYMFGILLGVLGIMKIKDHVENPQQTALKDGAIRLAAGGALFALPIVFEAMLNTVGSGNAISAAKLQAVKFNVT